MNIANLLTWCECCIPWI